MSEFNIQLLEKEKWQGHEVKIVYTSRHFYDVSIEESQGNFHVSFIKKPYEGPYLKVPDFNDRLFGHWWDNVMAWGVIENDELLAVAETCVESWNNRLRVSLLWVHEDRRRLGIGKALMDLAVNRAKEENRRAVVLETQSSNEAGIAFYLAYGFSLIGFDACAYRNNDLERREVRLEMGLYLIKF